mmetsp:Transcript_35963/g.107422  ORF Transcript_35963/g.107422 Transcript_35963/m.107422 type:complete len:196 (+) Transcript_35963:59-646(+)|eukprot:CAMPEP_0175242048 /NCGR_PEP_ID=MMETSP0093-20121207/30869_1 /TAXON_ID=311494 /ORGANISM="Alexandrium monilatum, Strain CCMP3105" /LENGTH=195 /DNA_ID=CAMNT_0016536115 /DNA_START=53 /DNA_END=640 /DNA_ORIENTATION=-
MSSYTVYYHSACKGFTGRAFAPLCLLEAGGAAYECKAPDELPAGSSTFAPPMVAFPDGNIASQTGVLCIALGQAFGLAPEGAAASVKAMQLAMDAGDLMSDILGKKGAERIMKWVNYFEGVLGDGPYMTGGKATYVDYCAMGTFVVFPLKQAKGVEDFAGVEMTPKVKAWFELMSADPAVKKVLDMAPFLPDSFI